MRIYICICINKNLKLMQTSPLMLQSLPLRSRARQGCHPSPLLFSVVCPIIIGQEKRPKDEKKKKQVFIYYDIVNVCGRSKNTPIIRTDDKDNIKSKVFQENMV